MEDLVSCDLKKLKVASSFQPVCWEGSHGIYNFVKLVSCCLASGLKFERCNISVVSKVDTPLMIQYQEQFQ